MQNAAVRRRHRRVSRLAAEFPGLIVFGEEATQCWGADLTPNGVRVRFVGAMDLPAKVHFIEALSGLAYEARVTWTAAASRRVGLEFTECWTSASRATASSGTPGCAPG